MRLTVGDLIAEIRDNFKAILGSNDWGPNSCSWNTKYPEGSVAILDALSLAAEPPISVGVTVRLDANARSITAEYFGLNQQPRSYPVPFKNDEFDLSDNSPLYPLCEEILEPLKHVRCDQGSKPNPNIIV